MAMLIVFSGFAAVILVGSILVAINDTLEAHLSENIVPERASSPVAAHRPAATTARNYRESVFDRPATPRHMNVRSQVKRPRFSSTS